MGELRDDIEKYKKGELTPSEMHKLERKALADPFLADALEGAEAISNEDFFTDLKELNKKIGQENKPKIIFTPLRIAAGIFIVLGVSFLLYFISDISDKEQVQLTQLSKKDASGAVESPTQPADSANKNLITFNTPETKRDKIAPLQKQEPILKSTESKSLLDSQSANNDIVQIETLADDITENRKDESNNAVPMEDLKKVEKTEEIMAKAEEKETTKELPNLEITEQIAKEKKDEGYFSSQDKKISKNRAKKVAAPSLVAGATLSTVKPLQTIAGQVTSAEDGTPLSGVNVIVKGTTVGTITDEYGNYSITVAGEEPHLTFSSIGLETDEIAVNDQSTINVALKADVSQSSEIVIIGYGGNDDKADGQVSPTLLLAEPVGGKQSFKNYLETNLKYPSKALENKIEGKVTVQFTVKTDSTLADFKVIKGIGYDCENELIRLIKEGPKWSPSRKGQKVIESSMRVQMRFKLPN